MKVGIMQPYVFPYLGYFQLINAVDKFIIYDDVNFIKQGWINRNRILLNNQGFLYTIPLKDASSYKLIKDVEVDEKYFETWKRKFYKSIEQAYRKAPYYEVVNALIKNVFESAPASISAIAIQSIRASLEYIEIDSEIILSSTIYTNTHLSGQDRVIDICLQTKATQYINAEGGKELYRKEDFKRNGIVLNFLKANEIRYKQYNEGFIPSLSFIDVMMFNNKEEIKRMLSNFSLT